MQAVFSGPGFLLFCGFGLLGEEAGAEQIVEGIEYCRNMIVKFLANQSGSRGQRFVAVDSVAPVFQKWVAPREQMFNLELAQRWLVNRELYELVPDPAAAGTLSEAQLRAVMTAIIEDEGASIALRKHVAARYPVVNGRAAPRTRRAERIVPDTSAVCSEQPAVASPPYRRIRVYGADPTLSSRLDTAGSSEVRAPTARS